MYEMKPEYYIGIDMIDEEHKQLFKYADDAYELLHDENTPDKYDRIDMILEDLRDYTAKHFNDEEQYMLRHMPQDSLIPHWLCAWLLLLSFICLVKNTL